MICVCGAGQDALLPVTQLTDPMYIMYRIIPLLKRTCSNEPTLAF